MNNNKLAVVFPGQGSQAVGMLKDLNENFTQIRETFIEGSNILEYDLWDLVQNGPSDKLNQTEFTQPAVLVAGVAVWRILQDKFIPMFMAGHSLGEYTALVCAGSIDFSDAIKLVRKRGCFMQGAYGGEGAMVAIVGLSNDLIEKVCLEASQDEVLVPANYNSIGQTVLSGNLHAAKRATDIAKSLGAKIAKIIPVSVPAHCALMKPAAEKLSRYLDGIKINTPKIRVINNVDVRCFDTPDKIRDALVRQLYNPVRWVEIIQFMKAHNVQNILECGPGKVLTGLNKRIDADILFDFVGTSEKINNLLNNK
jgi:[acyl-carrier-protein] S-malonyltransferase